MLKQPLPTNLQHPQSELTNRVENMSRRRFFVTYLYSFFALIIILLTILTTYNVDELSHIFVKLFNSTCYDANEE